jgi:serine/threonine-protein kinase PRP4
VLTICVVRILEIRVGELINGRYRVVGIHGKGVYSTVVKALDIQDNNLEVAVKISRNNETMYVVRS